MKLSKDILPNYFEIASPNNSHYQVETNTFDFVSRDSNILLVTIGDSWTWGADIHPTNDEEFRIKNVFGNIISDKLNIDWLNLSRSGSNNFYIAEKVEEFGKIVNQLDYQQIYIVCTFTEIGRSFNSHHDIYIDYIDWFSKNSIDNFLHFLNAECVNRIKKITQLHGIKLLIGTNFIDAIGIDTDILLPTPWFRLLGIECPTIGYAGATGVLRLRATEEFTSDILAYKSWMIDLIKKSHFIDQANRAPQLINAHPTVAGHKIWAKYILENLK